jgi:hypothetical protein
MGDGDGRGVTATGQSDTVSNGQSDKALDGQTIRGTSFDPTQGPTVSGTLQNLRFEDFLNSTRLPCLQNAFLTGWIAGLGSGVLHYLRFKRLRSASNWGVVLFGLGSSLSWEYCRYQRRLMQIQLDNMAVELNQKKASSSPDSSPTVASTSR